MKTISAVVVYIVFNMAAIAAERLQIYILAGQSNMQGHASISTFEDMASDSKTQPLLKELLGPDGKPRICERVWISSVGCAGNGWSDVIEQKGILTAGFGASPEKIGPEFTFGLHMEKHTSAPILIIKTSWGGRSLMTDFRPPGAGKRVFNDFIKEQWKNRFKLDVEQEAAKVNENCSVFYRHMIDHVNKVLGDIKRVVPSYDEKQGYQLAGFVWFQGFNDYVDDWSYRNRETPGGYAEYGQLLAQFMRDVRKDLSAPKMPFVIGIMGIDGMKNVKPAMNNFRLAQAAPTELPEFKGNVVAVHTAQFWDDELAALQERAEKKAKLTTEELKRLKAGVSNGGYHYLGAAKIMAPIGKAFAQEIINLRATLPIVK